MILTLLACLPRTAPTDAAAALPSALPSALAVIAPAPKTLEYEECSIILEGMEPVCVPVMEVWTGPVTEGVNQVWDVTVEEGAVGDKRVREVQRVFYGPTGTGWLGTGVRERPYEVFSNPKVVLPAAPKIGDAWSGAHDGGGRPQQRACEIRGAASCPGGVVSHCDTTYVDQRRVVLDQHFCPGVGFVGYEGTVQPPGGFTLRMWSRNMKRDGIVTAPFR